MPTLHLFLLFLAADLALKLTPGPDMALTLTRGMTQGFRIAWLSVLGTFCAGFVQIPLAVLGLAALFKESPALFVGVKLLGALYMAYLGIKALRRSRQARELAAVPARGTGRDVFVQGFLTNLLNPKVSLFLIAFLPQFTDPAQGPVWRQMLVLACVSKVFGLFSGAGFAYGASRIRPWLTRNRWFLRAQEGALGAMMLAIAGYMVAGTDVPATK
ncbi:LysE family translocator [Bordetella genomosp. 13]|uniref:LysE family translocator n=1 Tax=Bordetella genomosp. 13 TaxID=463040 RepID=UPI001642EDE3|nr:LysE family translocator [Bordetella genomosp. 13]